MTQKDGNSLSSAESTMWAGAVYALLLSVTIFASFTTLSGVDLKNRGEAGESFWVMMSYVICGVSAVLVLSTFLLTIKMPDPGAHDKRLSDIEHFRDKVVKVGSVVGDFGGTVAGLLVVTVSGGGGSFKFINRRFGMFVFALFGSLVSLVILPNMVVLPYLWLSVASLILVRGMLAVFKLLPGSWVVDR